MIIELRNLKARAYCAATTTRSWIGIYYEFYICCFHDV